MITNGYLDIYENIRYFRGELTSKFSHTDNPAKYFFKIFFHFDNGGLLDSRIASNERYEYIDSAINYLAINGEFERVELLKKFIHLLSNINTYSPWYFSEIDGLMESIDRKQFIERDFKIDEARPKIIIKTLPDAVDDRIGTLLDLYKSICFSYIQKKEVIPANLRRFNMGIYVFQTPTQLLHRAGDNYATFDNGTYKVSSKYFEFVNCEIFLPSAATPYANLNNKEGIEHAYEIGITFDDVFDERYNDIMLRTIGDFILTDMMYLTKNGTEVIQSVEQTDNDDRNYSQLRKYVHINPENTWESDIKDKKISDLGKGNQIIHDEDYGKLQGNKSILTSTNIGRNITSAINTANTAIDKMRDNYSLSNIANNGINYAINKLDSSATKSINDIVYGNLFYDTNIGDATRIVSDLINGNIGGVINQSQSMKSNASPQNTDVSGSLFNEKTSDGWVKKTV